MKEEKIDKELDRVRETIVTIRAVHGEKIIKTPRRVAAPFPPENLR